MIENVIHITEKISDDEILVRFIFDSDFKNKKVEVLKIIDGDVFLDTRDLGVSLQRNFYCSELECKKLATNIPNKNYVGFVIFKKDDFLKVKENYIKERKEFDAEIRFTPLDENNQIINDKKLIFTNTPKNPSHSDLFYLNPALVNDETPKTVIRFFSKKLFRFSKIIIDDFPNSVEYKMTKFSDYY